MITFANDRLLLRPWKEGDEESLQKYANNRKVSINLRDRFPYPYTLNDAKEWIKLAGSQSPIVNFALEVESCAVGGIGLVIGEDIFRRSAEIGYWLGEPFWNRGLMTEAVRFVTEYGFFKLDLIRIYAGIFEGNSSSAKVLEKSGYILESCMRKSVFKEGQILDQFIYTILRE